MSRFRLNPHLARDLAKQDAQRRMLEATANEVADHANTLARQAQEPWMKRQAQTIVVQQDESVTAVINTDYAAHLVEFGSKNNPAHAPLRRAVRAAGLHLREVPKGAA